VTGGRIILRGRHSISIHALRGEGDRGLYPLPPLWDHFNPRPPWGGRLNVLARELSEDVFQSPPSMGRTTLHKPHTGLEVVISIPALRREGDRPG